MRSALQRRVPKRPHKPSSMRKGARTARFDFDRSDHMFRKWVQEHRLRMHTYPNVLCIYGNTCRYATEIS